MAKNHQNEKGYDKLGWKLFAWIYGVLVILASIFNLSSLNFLVAVYFSIGYLEIIGLFGFAYKKKIFNNIFWKLFFFIDVLKHITIFSMLLYRFPSIHALNAQIIIYIVTLLVVYLSTLFTILFTLFRYAFKGNNSQTLALETKDKEVKILEE